MSPAELRTAHDALGVSTELIAERIGCHVNMIWRYEHPDRQRPVPLKVEEAVRDMLNDFDVAAERIAAEVEVRGEGFVPRYTSAAVFDQAVPELAGWGERSQGLLVAEVQRRLQLPVEYVA